MRILLATDGSEASSAAARAIADMAFPAETEVKVVSVINPIRYSLEEIGFLRGKETERAHYAIGKIVNVLGNAPLKLTAEVIAGRRVRHIVARARDWNADLIVVGAEEREGLKRLMSRGTAVEVANRAHCSVRVVRGNNASLGEEPHPSLFEPQQDRGRLSGFYSRGKVDQIMYQPEAAGHFDL